VCIAAFAVLIKKKFVVRDIATLKSARLNFADILTRFGRFYALISWIWSSKFNKRYEFLLK